MLKISQIVILLAFITLYECKPLESCSNDKPCFNHKTYRDNSKIYCDLCELFLPAVRSYLKDNQTERLAQLATFVCDTFKIEDNFVCNQIIQLFQYSVLSVLRDSPLNSEELCALGLNCHNVDNPFLHWNVTLPKVPKPPVTPFQPPKPNSPTIRILQLSDIHIDFEYQPGALAECGQPLCCRNSSTLKNNDPFDKSDESKLAGYWGDYRNCDVPVWTVENMFDHISKNEKVKYIFIVFEIIHFYFYFFLSLILFIGLVICHHIMVRIFVNGPHFKYLYVNT